MLFNYSFQKGTYVHMYIGTYVTYNREWKLINEEFEKMMKLVPGESKEKIFTGSRDCWNKVVRLDTVLLTVLQSSVIMTFILGF